VAEPNPTEERDERQDETRFSKIWSSIQEGFKKNLSQVLWFVGILGLYLLLGRYLFGFLEGYVDPNAIQDRSKEATARKDLVQALGFLMVGVAGAVGIYFTWRGQRITQKSMEDTRKSTTEEQELTRQGQITERFTRAIDQLGATDDKGQKKLEIRLGGIYALGRIAKDSPERDYGPVVEVLTAYVRENAPRHSEKFSRLASAWNWLTTRGAKKDEGTSQGALSERQSLQADIQAILVVLTRRHKDGIPVKYHVRFNLDNTDLRRAHLTEPDLRDSGLWKTNLGEASLPGADFREADLEEAILEEAKLQQDDLKADFTKAHLKRANLQGANLQGANLREADLGEAILLGADLNGADLNGAQLQRADLNGAVLHEADLRKASLQLANLQEAMLQGAILQEASLATAILHEAYLREADLRKATLERADLRGAILQDADLKGANLQGETHLTQEQLEKATGDDNTCLPPDLKPPAHWNVKTDEQIEGE
jgi:uncharacterized protein YjbI with pentapeptide repeats